MFGYIQPDKGELKVREYSLYQAVYCGLCRTQRKNTGFFSCLTLSYDFVFFYLLRSELTATKTELITRKSLFQRQKKSVVSQNPQLLYSAGAAALLNYCKLKDDLADEPFLKRLTRRLLLPYARLSLRKAEKKTALPKKEIEGALCALSTLEKENAPADKLAEESAKLLSVLLSYGIDDPLYAMAAGRIGDAIGEWLYLTDAADDLVKDRKLGRFNPFSEEFRGEDLSSALDCHAEEAELILEKVPIFDVGCRAILNNVLRRGLHRKQISVLKIDESRNID